MKKYIVEIVWWLDYYNSDTDFEKHFFTLRGAKKYIKKHTSDYIKEWNKNKENYVAMGVDIEKIDRYCDTNYFITNILYFEKGL